MTSATARLPNLQLLRLAWQRWRMPAWLGLSIVGLLAVPYIVWANRNLPTIIGFDGYATWSLNFDNLYGVAYMDLAAFRYTPAYAQAFSWAHLLPWELFGAIWIGASFAILAWWGRRWTLALIALPPVALELYHGNIHLFMALAIVVGFRYPSAWAFLFLAKVTPGIGVLWFAGRREWRKLFIALGTTAVITAVSFAVAPHQWFDFVRVSYNEFMSFDPPRPYPFPIPWIPRAVAAAAIALWGGHTNRRWTVPVAATLALPIIWIHGLTMLLAIIPLLREDAAVKAKNELGERAKATPAGDLALAR